MKFFINTKEYNGIITGEGELLANNVKYKYE